ncbi:MAG TPA: hypothetical protein VMR06_11470 [Dokdonella sp.]|uniref:hypothetical protein n=1 Tax=Dokdonella sp. TaxID=2291710 RepID=UPI002CEB5C44|nr:hypothetical protein [Dokdonella sp.]HUD42597.1 hypothetical protein [Dokdonella sp.]
MGLASRSAEGSALFLEIDDWRRWCESLAPWLDQRFHPTVLERFHEAVQPDWLTWLDAEQAAQTGTNDSSRALFAPYLHATYQGVRVFHATRLPDLNGVRAQGLRAWSADELRLAARDALDAAVAPVQLERSIALNDPVHRGGRVYSFASLSHTLGTLDGDRPGRLPAFARQGGEFLGSVAEQAGVGEHYTRRPGRAFLLACDVPWESMSDDLASGIAHDVLTSLLTWRFLDVSAYSMLGRYECISTHRDIPPESIQAFADVEHAVDRTDVKASEIPWQAFRHDESLR